jgi:septation ring formation regulator EzrA
VLKVEDARIAAIRQHMQRYKELTAQGKIVDAARELEAVQNEVGK